MQFVALSINKQSTHYMITAFRGSVCISYTMGKLYIYRGISMGTIRYIYMNFILLSSYT